MTTPSLGYTAQAQQKKLWTNYSLACHCLKGYFLLVQ